SCFQVNASSFAQRVTIDVKEASLEHVLDKIREQTNYDFLYNSSQIKDVKSLNLHFKDADLKTVLDACLQNQGLTYELDKETVLIKPVTYNDNLNERRTLSQQKEIVGRVTDETGEPLIGVTVSIKGTTVGTSTDIDGSYRLSLTSTEGVLLCSAVGYEPFDIGAASAPTTLNVVLKLEPSDLDEVVVVGYGTQKRVNLTGAVSQVKGDDIAVGSSANVASALQGLLPGLNIQINNGDPTGTPDINVRGFN